MDRSEQAATVPRPDYGEYWERGLTWGHFLEDEVEKNVELWKGVYDTHRTPEWAVERVEALGGDWRLLTIAEDWCGDASNTVPVVVRFVEAASNLDLRILKRDENPELMDNYLTNGSRSIPVVIVLDADARPVGHWAPRPAELQEWVVREKRSGERPSKEIYRDARRWYARDKGESTLRELIEILERANGGVPESGETQTGDPEYNA